MMKCKEVFGLISEIPKKLKLRFSESPIPMVQEITLSQG